jgi:hypothetical protein
MCRLGTLADDHDCCMLGILRTREPMLRIIKWLRTRDTPGGDIPLEAECTACSDVKFGIAYDVRQNFHAPTHDDYLANLQRAFDRHFELVHVEHATKAPRNPKS